jgi:F-type H+-transporting ATPase subunit alpha
VAGDLKLAYAQFEELETFSRFGARLDEESRKTIEHGRRIRACLKQPESDPVPVPAQIVVLQALTAGLFDGVPLARMPEAERALRDAAAELPGPLCERLVKAAAPSAVDTQALLALARAALAPFQAAAAPQDVAVETDRPLEVKP